MTETIRGFIDSIKPVGFNQAILSVKAAKSSLRVYVANTVSLSDLQIGCIYDFHGTWTNYLMSNGYYQKQFEIQAFDLKPLSGELIKPLIAKAYHVGQVTANKLVEHYGDEISTVLSDLSRMPEALAVIDPKQNYMSSLRIQSIYKLFADASEATKLKLAELDFYMRLEKELGFGDRASARQIFRLLGEQDTWGRLMKNPYIGSGIAPWKDADAMGLRILEIKNKLSNAEAKQHPERFKGATLQVNNEVLSTGSTICTLDQYHSLLSRRLEATDKKSLDDATHIAMSKNLIRIEDGWVQPMLARFVEFSLASRIKRIEVTPNAIKMPGGLFLERMVETTSQENGIALSWEQLEVVKSLLKCNFAILQGGAGVGKTTVMRVLVEQWKKFDGHVLMCALAGKAALQLSRAVRSEIALTITRLIMNLSELKKNDEAYARAIEEGIKEGQEFTLQGLGQHWVSNRTLLIIDEASMCDSMSLKRLFELLPPEVNVLLVGDRYQLPPVTWGQPFADIESSKAVDIHYLTEIFRQKTGSTIPAVAAEIQAGNVPAISQWKGEMEGVYYTTNHLAIVFADLNSMGILDHLCVAETNRSVAAINRLFSIQSKENEDKGLIIHQDCTLYNGSPVIFNQNRYRDGLMNGQLGHVVSVETGRPLIQWDGEKEPHEAEPELWPFIDLAHAITVHKSQGSSATAVVIELEGSKVLNNPWLYTAVTRGKELVLFHVKDPAMLEALSAPLKLRSDRKTGFEKLLLENQPQTV